jgi:hypothetical protein
MAHAVLGFNEQIERIGEVAAVMIIGMLLWAIEWPSAVVVRAAPATDHSTRRGRRWLGGFSHISLATRP